MKTDQVSEKSLNISLSMSPPREMSLSFIEVAEDFYKIKLLFSSSNTRSKCISYNGGNFLDLGLRWKVPMKSGLSMRPSVQLSFYPSICP